MSSRVTRDHHNFRRTVSLNGNKISNDGGDEGISVSDDGGVAVSGNLRIAGSKITGDGVLEIDAAGAVSITDQNLYITDGQKIVFDGAGGDTYMAASGDRLDFVVGDDTVARMFEDGTSGNYVKFDNSCAGFDIFTPTFDATDTYVYFQRHGHKASLTLTGDITDINLVFPNISGNFVLKLVQDGTGGREITNWKTFDQTTNGNESTVQWPGGDDPTLSTGASSVDIISFFWDNTAHKAYGIASYNFS